MLLTHLDGSPLLPRTRGYLTFQENLTMAVTLPKSDDLFYDLNAQSTCTRHESEDDRHCMECIAKCRVGDVRLARQRDNQAVALHVRTSPPWPA